jgi:hypothetical protein
MPEFNGGCLCGKIRYQSKTDVVLQGNCHCIDCKKVSGSPFTTYVCVPEETLNIMGELKIFTWTSDSGNDVTHEFCTDCGSQVIHKSPIMAPGMVMLKSGTLDDMEDVKPAFDMFVNKKCQHVIMDESLGKFNGMPDL